MFTVNYSGAPQIAKNAPWDGGFSFATDKNGNPWVGVSCEGLGPAFGGQIKITSAMSRIV